MKCVKIILGGYAQRQENLYFILKQLVTQKQYSPTENPAQSDCACHETRGDPRSGCAVTEAMHPADLVGAYRDLTFAGKSPDEIAPLFGVSPLTVKRYLKLANVSPMILALYADDEIDFEQISALVLTDDHELQEQIWKETPAYNRSGAAIRRMITESEVCISRSPLAKYVGVKVYEKAGGMIRRDLFSDDEDGYMQDAGLLERLALAKLNKAAEKVKTEQGLAWVECRTQSVGYSDLSDYGRISTMTREPTVSEQNGIEALETELQVLLDEHSQRKFISML